MAKDYRRKSPPSPKGSSFSKQLLLVLVSFLLGYLSASNIDFTSTGSWLKAQLLAPNTTPASNVSASLKSAEPPRPKFEFYTLLANEHGQTQPVMPSKQAIPSNKQSPQAPSSIPSSVSNVIATTEAKSSPPVVDAKALPTEMPGATVASKDSFLVQVASFRFKQEAERMKATLALKGFMVNITMVNQQQVTWYRLYLGPFSSRLQAEKAKLAIAQSEHIQGMIRKMDA